MIRRRLSPRSPRPFRSLARDRRGVAFTEFALIAPLFLGFMLSAIECANFVMANFKVQRLATMMADLVAQSGTGGMGINEAQISDLFFALDISARPFDLRENGRVVLSALQGVDANNDKVAESNKVLWQRFDGGFVEAPIRMGCWTSNPAPVLVDNRILGAEEIAFHAQVTYRYEPIFMASVLRLFDAPETITRSAMFRLRGKKFTAPQQVPGHAKKDNCNTADGH